MTTFLSGLLLLLVHVYHLFRIKIVAGKSLLMKVNIVIITFLSLVIEYGSCGSKCNSNDPDSSCYLNCRLTKDKPCAPGCWPLCDENNTEEYCSKFFIF